MKHDEYVFEICPMDIVSLLPQASRALEKRTELTSRRDHPDLWERADQLSAKRGAPGGITKQSRTRTRLLSLTCLALGIFLFVPGLTDPQGLTVPLLAGAVGIGAGIGGLWRSRKAGRNPFDRSAEILLAGKDAVAEGRFRVTFSQDGMTIADAQADSGNAGEEFVPYGDFECVVETEDAILVSYGERVTLLQKSDLTAGDIDGLRKLMSEQIPLSSLLER